MKEIFQKLKLPLIIVAVLVGGFIVYNSFIKAPASTALLQTNGGVATSTPGQNFLPLLVQIQGVTLDQRLFLDPVFRALIDFTQPIVPESVGKQNPFSGTLSGSTQSSVESLGYTDSASSNTTVAPPAVRKPPVPAKK